jgi:rhombotail lipoprotein
VSCPQWRERIGCPAPLHTWGEAFASQVWLATPRTTKAFAQAICVSVAAGDRAGLQPLAALLFALPGCATQARYDSSVVDDLYPKSSDPIEEPAIPVRKLPMKVGVAFVPDSQNRRHDTFWQSVAGGGASKPPDMLLTENQKLDLMQEVSGHFRQYEFIGSIDVIPSAYLTPQGSFANLVQVRTMYGVDAIVLLSYDQVQFTDEGASSFLYWTIVGAYVVPGEKNSTQTMMDAVVYDIKSRKMLIRAPDTSQIAGTATPVNLSKELRNDSDRGFRDAAKNMIANLDLQLDVFREKVKQEPEQYELVHREGYTGGGALGVEFLALLAVYVGAAWSWPRRV